MPVAVNESIGILHHHLHGLVLADLHWQYGGKGSSGDLHCEALPSGGVRVRQPFEETAPRKGHHQPQVEIVPQAAGRFQLNLWCTCGFTRANAKPGAICLHLWSLVRGLSGRVEHRQWHHLAPLRDLLGVSAAEEARVLFDALERDLTTREREDAQRQAEQNAKQIERRLVWVVDLGHHRPLEPALQPRTRTGWGKVRPLRDLAQALTVPFSDTDRLLLGLLVDDQERALRSFALWRNLASQHNLIDETGQSLVTTVAGLSLVLQPDEPTTGAKSAGLRVHCQQFEGREDWVRFYGDDVVVALGHQAGGQAQLLVLAATTGQTLALARLARHPVAIPPELLTTGAVAAVTTRLGVAPPGEARELPPGVVPGIFLERQGHALLVEFQVRPLAEGPWFVPGHGVALVSARRAQLAGSEEWVHTRRDPAGEHAAAKALAGRLLLSTTDRAEYRWLLGAEPALALVARLADLGLNAHWKGAALSVSEADEGSLSLRIVGNGTSRDWLDLGGGVEVDGQIVQLAQLLQALKERRGYVAVNADRLIRLSAGLRRRLELVAAAADEHGRKAATLAAPLLAEAIADLLPAQVETDAAWGELAARIAAAGNVDDALPAGFVADLRPYQRDGYRWLARLAHWGAGAVLADDMGLGKTVQATAMLVRRAPLGPQLVVMPTSVEGNWIDELARFAPGLRVRLLRTDRDLAEPLAGEVILASYQLAARGAERLKLITWATLVLDEAQMVKNAAAKRAAALAEFNAAWRVALTGTPVENRLAELWSIVNLVLPGLFGSWASFRERFARPIEVDRDAGASERLRLRLAPFVLRRTKEQVATDLPPITEVVRLVVASEAEQELLTAERARALAEIDAGKGRDAQGGQRLAIFAALTRLRQLACAPQLLMPGSAVPSSKLIALRELVGAAIAEGHRLLVFSQFTSLLDLVERDWAATGWNWLRLDGSTQAQDRRDRVARFQRGEGEVFLLSLKAGGTGINLTAASYVIHLDPWWNPAAEDQASDRAHRLGQTRPVTVYRLILSGTVEEKILALHRQKRDLVDAVLSGADRAAQLSEEDLMALLRDGASGAAGGGS
jgi:SNF2-related domain/Helicase conserved C-terminal domain